MKTVERSHIGLLIKKRRSGLKMSQEKLGEMIGVSYQQIQKYESGANRVSADKLKEIASALNSDVSYFYEKSTTFEVHEEEATYEEMKGLSPDEKELVRSFRGIDDNEFRKTFLRLLTCAVKKG